jgi:hypothetical protein
MLYEVENHCDVGHFEDHPAFHTRAGEDAVTRHSDTPVGWGLGKRFAGQLAHLDAFPIGEPMIYNASPIAWSGAPIR